MDGNRFDATTAGPHCARISAPSAQTEDQWLAAMKPEERRAFALLRQCRLIGADDLFRAAWPGKVLPAAARDRALEALACALNRHLLRHYHAAAPGTLPGTWELQTMQPAGRFVFDAAPYRDCEPAGAGAGSAGTCSAGVNASAKRRNSGRC